MRTALSDSVIAGLDADVVEVWDTRVAGLVLRRHASGRAIWSVRTRTHDGKRARVKLGEYPHIKVSAARRLALVQLAAIQQGRDPVAERRAAREARRAAIATLTVGTAMTEWQAARSNAPEQPWSPRYARAMASAIRVHVRPELWNKPLREVTREMWTRMLARVALQKPGAGAFLYTGVSSFLGYAEIMGWIEHHPLPRRGRSLIAPHVAPRTRVLEDWEWKAVWLAAEREPPKLRAFTRLLLLTATRVSETADIAIDEIIPEPTLWLISGQRTKNGHDHTVPLGDLAQAELRAVWPQGSEIEANWMLLGRSPKAGFAGRGKLLRRLQAASGTTGWTWHDLQRTARTTMTYLGVPESDAEAALNHITRRGGLVGVYDRSGPLPSALTALRVWQGYVADVLADRRFAGDAERQHRAMLSEEYRERPRAEFEPRPKTKPGRPRRDRVVQPSR